ncbi:uncharacterized protein BDZ99DRAFT_410664 [Mytilinidion resinicola]|uniref:endo-1,3(4)-beta-glucanase n=1 Tax=Mytilinidion resinicola TaxID=574789 RepID=A0A6A6YZ83_9PEZI|nr:uncharacterized protein BDZ99DRAFT_410664 [Mytilinidion resinicola]KAF2814246.1 hypothetical protein BDZ99DRAFT_410664 [Mytilinidion resinicola]
MPQTSLKTAAIATALAFASVTSAHYSLVDDYTKEKFFPGFDFFTGPDPTSGFVQYQSLEQSIANQYIGYLNDSVYLGVDYTNKTPQGRPSVRVEGKKAYNQGLLIVDVLHMPDSTCGSWPALWMFGPNWPASGEADLLEGANDQSNNIMTLHTSAGCAVDNASTPLSGGGNVNNNEASFLGNMNTKNCDVNATDQAKNVGCSIEAPSSIPPPVSQRMRRYGNENAHSDSLPSYGTDFNQAGGGVYAMEWTNKFIAIYFFSHATNETMPKDLLSGNPNPSGWGTPLARFAGNGCDFTKRFKDMKIVINLTFCGEWAGKVWTTGGCAAKTKTATCEAYVENNPDAFSEAYWEIASLKWFEDKDGGQ